MRVTSSGGLASEGRGAGAPQIIRIAADSLEGARERFSRDVHDGLSRSPKALPSAYFYDARGSELFRKIMDLPEYYLTRAETEILERHGGAIAAAFSGGECDVVDLGAGDGSKTALLLVQLKRVAADVRYVPVDVSEAALVSAIEGCTHRLPRLQAAGVLAQYHDGLSWLARRDPGRRRLVLFLGSNVGNMDDATAGSFFRALRAVLLPGDHVLVGFDLLKDPSLLLRAYDDAAGVTAEFNLNLLRRINRELEGDFQPSAFRHHATFAPGRRAMESYLLSTQRQSVRVAGRSYDFAAWEPLHTEVSRKYREADVHAFARDAGFVEATHFRDERRLFLDALWRVEGRAEGSPA